MSDHNQRGMMGRLAIAKDIADTWASTGAGVVQGAAKGLFEQIGRRMSNQGTPSTTGDEDIGRDALMLGPGMLLPGFGRAAGGLGAAGGRGVAGARATQVSKILNDPPIQNLIHQAREAGRTDAEIAEILNNHFRLEEGTITGRSVTGNRQRAEGSERANWTPEMVNRLKALDETFAGTPNQNKNIIANFRELHPDYPGSDSTIITMLYRKRAWGGVNEATGAESASKASGAGGEFELGAMGGRPAKFHEGDIIGDGPIGPKRTFTADDVTDFLKQSGVSEEAIAVKRSKGKTWATGTDYVKVTDDNGKLVTVRLPNDKVQHLGYPLEEREFGHRFDTGAYVTPKSVNDPRAFANQSGETFADRAAMEDALRWRLSRSPDGQWLIPEERAPLAARTPREPAPTPAEAEAGPVKDPRQNKLLSGGIPVNPWDQFQRADGQ